LFALHRDEETKTLLSKPRQTILPECGDRKSVMILIALHRDEETKTLLSKQPQTILPQCGDRKSVMNLLLRLTMKKEPKMHKNRNTAKRKTI
jgi:hypothetical protein